MIADKKRSFSPFFISVIIHAFALFLLAIFPPTKSLIFFKIHKKNNAPISEIKEKILEEISVIKITKKNPENQVSEILNEDIAAIIEDEILVPRFDLSQELVEKIDLNFPIDQSSSLNYQTLEKTERPYQDYLSPLTNPIPDYLLNDEEPIAKAFEPKPFVKLDQTLIEPPLTQLDDLDFSSFVTQMPEMLDTELYTYKDSANDEFFKMELKLKDHKLFEEKPQSFLFILDMTQKNSKKKWALYKDAIIKSLKYLKPTDRFNVIVINKQLTTFFKEAISVKSHDALQLEELFHVNFKNEGRMKDLARHLGSVFYQSEESELHTHCIFFTEEPKKDDEAFLKLAKYAHSKLSFYPVIYSEKPLEPLHLKNLVENIGGRILSPPTKASFSRKFSSLILDIKQTRLRNVSIKIESDQGLLDVSLSEKTKQLTLKKPLKIFGKLKGAKNLKLQVMGSHGDDLFEMKKTLPIHGAKKGSSLIKKELDLE